MKEVIIFLRPNCYFKTKEALSEKRFFAMNTKEVLGRGRAHVSFTAGEGTEVSATDKIYENALIAKKMIQIVVPDALVDEVIDTVLSVNSHNTEGDGKIFVVPVEESIRIHTGETGEDALM
jgi:nitrogen regulatory protein PII 2